ncbi:MAG: hypothetical protein ACI4PF_01890 [Christensenellales bacterium]
MQINYKKTILKTILYTILALIVVSAIIVCFMYFVFTKDCADFMYNLGCDKIASNLYYKTYEKSGEIEYCYKALNIEIKLNDNNKVVKYYESLVNDDEYDEFIKAVIIHNENMAVGVLEKSSILNEENYLVNRYVRALIIINKFDYAWELTLNNFVKYNDWNFKEQGVYALSAFINESNKHLFNVSYDGLEDTLLNEMQKYFDAIYEIFNNNVGVVSNVDKSYLMALGNRIVSVGQDINNLYGNDETKIENKSNNIAMMASVNDVIKGLL